MISKEELENLWVRDKNFPSGLSCFFSKDRKHISFASISLLSDSLYINFSVILSLLFILRNILLIRISGLGNTSGVSTVSYGVAATIEYL